MEQLPGISSQLRRNIFIIFICAIALISFFCVDWSRVSVTCDDRVFGGGGDFGGAGAGGNFDADTVETHTYPSGK